MKLEEYLEDRLLLVILNLFCMLMMYLYLRILGNTPGEVWLILIAWLFILTLYLGLDYLRKKHYFHQLEDTMNSIDQRYLIGEVMEKGPCLEDKLYQNIIRESNKAVIEKIRQMEDEQKEYKEYIEGWIHEVKIPITTMELMCHNNRNEITRRMDTELAKVDNYVEMALYYARSDSVYKDYLIQKMSISEAVQEAIAKNKQYLIQNAMSIEVDIKNDEVYSDSKWVVFILNQIIINAIKYKKMEDSQIRFETKEVEGGILLVVEDNGIGIKDNEIDRIFQKGFTGTNGRNLSKSTGMGLYLCNKLCDKLGLGLSAESKESEYTRLILAFPMSSYLTKL